MTGQNNDSIGSGFAKISPVLKETAAELLTCCQGVQQSIALIQQSFDSPDTKGWICRDMLTRKIEELRNLYALCNKGAKQLAGAAAKLMQEYSEQEVLTEMRNLSRFIADQLHSEQAGARSILDTLRNRCSDKTRDELEKT